MNAAKPMCTLKLNAGHDVNGNPRRCIVIYDTTGGIHDVIDCGYRYSHAPAPYNKLPALSEISVSASEYRTHLSYALERRTNDPQS